VTENLGDEMTTTEPATEPNTEATAAAQPDARPAPKSQQERRAAIRKLVLNQLLLEMALPIAGYYVLRATGLDQWLALICSGLLALPAVAYSIYTQRRVSLTVFFSLSVVLLGTVVGLITGDPRLLVVRDGWVTAIIGLWILGTLFTRRPFMLIQARAILIAKVGEHAADDWDARYPVDAPFRRHIRLLTVAWGVVFAADSLIRVLVAYTLPLDAVPVVTTVQWLVVLGGLLGFHFWYITKHGLKL
jgi:hypothetical protein